MAPRRKVAKRKRTATQVEVTTTASAEPTTAPGPSSHAQQSPRGQHAAPPHPEEHEDEPEEHGNDAPPTEASLEATREEAVKLVLQFAPTCTREKQVESNSFGAYMLCKNYILSLYIQQL